MAVKNLAWEAWLESSAGGSIGDSPWMRGEARYIFEAGQDAARLTAKDAAQQDGGALIESLHRLAEQWRASMGSKPSSRRIETYNKEFGRGEDDFDNEAFGVRRCATELERMLESHERLAAKDAAQKGNDEFMREAVAAADGTLLNAIDYWQDRATKAEAELATQQGSTEAVNEDGLKACPFCGSARVDPKGWASENSAGPACDDCGASAGNATGDLQGNIAAWNRRAHPAPADPAVLRDAEHVATLTVDDDGGLGWKLSHMGRDLPPGEYKLGLCNTVTVLSAIAAQAKGE